MVFRGSGPEFKAVPKNLSVRKTCLRLYNSMRMRREEKRLSGFSLGLLRACLQRGRRSREPLEQRLLTCWQSLSSMASSNQLVDDGSCQ